MRNYQLIRSFLPLFLCLSLIGCNPSIDIPDLSVQSGTPAPVFLIDHVNSMEVIAHTGELSSEGEVLSEIVKIRDTVARSVGSRFTGAFSYTGDIQENSRLTTLIGVGQAPLELFNVFSMVPPINRYGPSEGEPPMGSVFRIHVNDELVFEQEIDREAYDIWHPVTVDLSDHAGDRVEIRFSTEGILVGTILPWWGNAQIVPQNPTPRRVLLIGLDTLAAGHCGFMGYNRDTTPNLDEFASGSTVFMDAHSSSPWTLPSFASVISGRYPGITGADRRNRGLSDNEDMLAEVYRRNDFTTAGFVNIPHLQEAGFFQGNDMQWEVHDHPASEALTEAKGWISDHADQDFFAFIHLFDPHIPYAPPEEIREKFVNPDYSGPNIGRWELPARIVTANHLDPEVWTNFDDTEKEQCENLYDADIAWLDEELGKFFNWYRDEGLFEDTTIIVFSDHGEEFGEHGRWEHGHSHYEEQLRVPMVIKLPGQVQGREGDGLVGTVDIYPTLLELFGFESFNQPSGESLVPVLQGRTPDPDRRLISESTLWGPESKAVITNDHKYILKVLTGEEEIYSLVSDAQERNNLIHDEPDYLSDLGDYLENYLNETQSGWHLRFLAGAMWPMSVELDITSDDPIGNPELIEQIFNGSGDGLTVIDENHIRVNLEMSEGDSVELRFTTESESAVIEFDGTINSNVLDGDPVTSSAMATIRLGSYGLSLPDLYAYLLSEGREVPSAVSGSALIISMDDPVIAFSFPEYVINEDRGAFLWTVPANLRAHAASLTDEQREDLESVGYLFN